MKQKDENAILLLHTHSKFFEVNIPVACSH
jgi:hypothetical protein